MTSFIHISSLSWKLLVSIHITNIIEERSINNFNSRNDVISSLWWWIPRYRNGWCKKFVKAAVTSVLVESADVDAVLVVEPEEDKLSVSGLNDGLSVYVGVIVTTTGNEALGESSDVDAVLGVELGEDKVAVTGLNYGLTLSIGDLVKTNSSPLLSNEIVSNAEVSVRY